MAFVIWLITIVAVYIATFKNDFQQEEIEKVAPILAIAAIVILLGSVALSLIAR